ncbi:MAG: 2-isopropylmalate synthase [Cocleimonas sp.]
MKAGFDHKKYKPFTPLDMPNRAWPNKSITAAPNWCSVDLRDGNQALPNPMNVEQKTRMFKLLVELGFKEIEVGFPSASQADFDFVRVLIEEDMIPDDVTIQVLTQAREDLISRSYESLAGVKQAIVHVYNSTSTVQREQVFRRDRQGIIDIALTGATLVKSYSEQYPDTQWSFQYSPESFSQTEMDYAVDICGQVIDIWQKDNKDQRVIINLPATVESAMPNIFADQIETFCNNIPQRDSIEISLHTHNDRGCGIAAAEMGILAGADRIEGTLLGNGERTGNMDIITMAMNLYSQGIDPELDISDMAGIVECVEYCTKLPVHPRHAWAGELVYTAFSGSHQDAIRKSIDYHKEHNREHWNVAYLPIDPRDIGREYEEVVRINSQSGKGGVALVLERDFGITLPKWMHGELSVLVQAHVDKSGEEITPTKIHEIFQDNFMQVKDLWRLRDYSIHAKGDEVELEFNIGQAPAFKGTGKGAFEALINAVKQRTSTHIRVIQFDEFALTEGTRSDAIAAVAVEVEGITYSACAIDEDITKAGLQALLSAMDSAVKLEQIAKAV